jgi:hypothetical protein
MQTVVNKKLIIVILTLSACPFPERETPMTATPSLFNLLRVEPLLGRMLAAIILSHDIHSKP